MVTWVRFAKINVDVLLLSLQHLDRRRRRDEGLNICGGNRAKGFLAEGADGEFLSKLNPILG